MSETYRIKLLEELVKTYEAQPDDSDERDYYLWDKRIRELTKELSILTEKIRDDEDNEFGPVDLTNDEPDKIKAEPEESERSAELLINPDSSMSDVELLERIRAWYGEKTKRFAYEFDDYDIHICNVAGLYVKEALQSHPLQAEQPEWNTNKVIDFVNWYLRICKVISDNDCRFELENGSIIESFLKGDDYRLWWNKFKAEQPQRKAEEILSKYKCCTTNCFYKESAIEAVYLGFLSGAKWMRNKIINQK